MCLTIYAVKGLMRGLFTSGRGGARAQSLSGVGGDFEKKIEKKIKKKLDKGRGV